MNRWDYVLFYKNLTCGKISGFADFCQLKVTFFGRTHRIAALREKHNG
jgi:hypothetical protein